jgi:lipopolysaccharide heptosyltransferase I
VPDGRPSSILIIRPSALGDVCRSVPLATSLRAAWPSARITWLVQDTFADAVRSHPAVDEVLLFPRSRWRRWWSPAVAAGFVGWLRDLGRGRFDLVVDAQGLGRSGLMAWATGATRRIGFADARELGWLGVNERYRVDAVHAVDRMLGLLRAAGIPPAVDLGLHLDPGDRGWWDEQRRRRGIGRYVLLAPTSRWATKDWPAASWRDLAVGLGERGFEAVVALGTAGERERVAAALPQSVAGGPLIVNLAGETTVGRSMAVVAAADLVVANDSAPLHIAVGFERPLLALFGPTDPALVGPYRRDGCVLRSDEAKAFRGSYRDRTLGDRLMRGIAVAEVLDAVDRGVPNAGLELGAAAGGGR